MIFFLHGWYHTTGLPKMMKLSFPIQRHDATRNASDDIRTKQMMMPSSDNDFNMKIAVAKEK